jgi:FtsH-binding integral membrane protein
MNSSEEHNLDFEEVQNLNYQGPIPVSMTTAENRATFYKKTYLHVAFAFLGFVFVEALLFQSGVASTILEVLFSMKFAMIAALIGFMFVAGAVEKWAQKATDKNTQYLALAVYIILEALIFVPLIGVALINGGSGALNDILIPGAIITIALFAGLVLTVFITGKDFTFMKAAVGIGFMIAMGIIAISWIFGLNLGSWFSIAMILLMSGAILYQTSQVQHQYHKEQYVAASVGIFASFMTLLWYVIRLLSDRS